GETTSLGIVDDTTAVDGDHDYDLQLQLYADAGRREGLHVRGAFVHDLSRGNRQPVDVDPSAIASAEAVVVSLAERLRARDFAPSPTKRACSRCDVRPLCRWAV
ncbi:MAG: PD-(D/E)XK nuclease family protein, partial [Acidimicrobiales bacterium]